MGEDALPSSVLGHLDGGARGVVVAGASGHRSIMEFLEKYQHAAKKIDKTKEKVTKNLRKIKKVQRATNKCNQRKSHVVERTLPRRLLSGRPNTHAVVKRQIIARPPALWLVRHKIRHKITNSNS